LFSGEEEACFAEGGGVARDFGLPFAEELSELTDGELFGGCEGEEARSHGVGEEAVELPAFGRGRGAVGAVGFAGRRHGERYMHSCE
jgi:hypothetical protein